MKAEKSVATFHYWVNQLKRNFDYINKKDAIDYIKSYNSTITIDECIRIWKEAYNDALEY